MRGLQKTDILTVRKIGTDYNPSDIGTKALGPLTFKRHVEVVVSRLPSAAPQEMGGSDQDGSSTVHPSAMLAAIALINSGAAGAWSIVKKKKK
jgi:hypothetical protein